MKHICSGDRVQGMVCGCHLDRCRECGAVRAVAKCQDHKAHFPHAGTSKEYFSHRCGNIVDGIPMNDMVIREMRDFLAKVGAELPRGGSALEVGAGIGRYAPLILKSGMSYSAVEPSPWGAEYIRHAYDCMVHQSAFEDLAMADSAVDLVLAAHVLEHLWDPAAALDKMSRILVRGGKLVLVIPDDSDLYNPDHLWFFPETALRRWVEEAGFVDVRTRVEQVLKREKFVYLIGVKP